MRTLTTETLADGFRFLEGPRWHDDRLSFSDMKGGKVFTLNLDGTVDPIVEVLGSPSGLGFLPDDARLIVSKTDQRLLRLEGDQLVCHAELASLVTGPINDMVVDELGTWVSRVFAITRKTIRERVPRMSASRCGWTCPTVVPDEAARLR